jgi:hypothetical protein
MCFSVLLVTTLIDRSFAIYIYIVILHIHKKKKKKRKENKKKIYTLLTSGRRSDALIERRENDRDREVRERERDDRDICSNGRETKRSQGRRRVSVLNNVQTTRSYY